MRGVGDCEFLETLTHLTQHLCKTAVFRGAHRDVDIGNARTKTLLDDKLFKPRQNGVVDCDLCIGRGGRAGSKIKGHPRVTCQRKVHDVNLSEPRQGPIVSARQNEPVQAVKQLFLRVLRDRDVDGQGSHILQGHSICGLNAFEKNFPAISDRGTTSSASRALVKMVIVAGFPGDARAVENKVGPQ